MSHFGDSKTLHFVHVSSGHNGGHPQNMFHSSQDLVNASGHTARYTLIHLDLVNYWVNIVEVEPFQEFNSSLGPGLATICPWRMREAMDLQKPMGGHCSYFRIPLNHPFFWSTYNPIPINCSLVGDLHIWDKGCLIFGGWEAYGGSCHGPARVGAKLLLGPYGDETFEAVAGDSRESWEPGSPWEPGVNSPFQGWNSGFAIAGRIFWSIFGQSACCHIKPSTFSGRLWGMVTSGDWPWPLEIHLDWPKILVISTQNWMIWTYSFLITLSWIIQSYSVSTSYTETQKKCGSVPIIIWVCHKLCRSNQLVPLWRAKHLETGSF